MDVVLLHNSGAGHEDHTEDSLVRLLKRHGYRATYAAVDKGLADKKLLQKAELVIAAGGDGTVRKTITRLAGREKPIAILPLGTANNIARSLGLALEVEQVIAGWKESQPQPVDLGVAKGPWGRTSFVEGLGFGLISRTMSILDELDKHVVYEFPSAQDKLHRDICVLAALTHEMPPVKARLTLSDERVKDDFLLLEILNISRAGPGVTLARDADPGDGWLNVVSVVAEERDKLLKQFERHVGGKPAGTRLHESPTKKLKLVVDPCELRIDDKIVLTPRDFDDLSDHRAEIDIKIEAGAVRVLGVKKLEKRKAEN